LEEIHFSLWVYQSVFLPQIRHINAFDYSRDTRLDSPAPSDKQKLIKNTSNPLNSALHKYVTSSSDQC